MPSAGGAEFNQWLSFTNRAVAEFAQAHDWEVLRKEFRPTLSGLTNATIPLPDDFRKLASSPVLWGGTAGGKEWSEIPPEQQHFYDTTEDWVQVWGDISGGYNLIWNPCTLASGASVTIQYFSVPTSLASPAQIPVVTDSQYLIDRVMAFIFEARSDPRFQQAEVKAREKLMNMIENADSAKYNPYGQASQIMTNEQRRGFRLGRD